MPARAFLIGVLAAVAAAQDLPVTGLAGVGVMTADLEQARQFYTGALGFSEAFSLKNERGQVVSAFFKVNDDQYIQVTAGPYADIRMAYVSLLTTDIQALRQALLRRGVIPAPTTQNPDGSRMIFLKDPDGARIEFVERPAGSQEARARGKYMTPRSVSRRLWHVGMVSGDFARSSAFYTGKLGFKEFWRDTSANADARWMQFLLPGQRGDVLELTLLGGNESYGSMQHICLVVPDVRAAIRKLADNGLPAADQLRPSFWRNGRRVLNLTDPGGTRIELMEPRPPR
jgi:catechol 2,3-dioxygenase-like lactoylglutathione lyase family enzyme